MSRILLVARLSQETPGQTGMDTGAETATEPERTLSRFGRLRMFARPR